MNAALCRPALPTADLAVAERREALGRYSLPVASPAQHMRINGAAAITGRRPNGTSRADSAKAAKKLDAMRAQLAEMRMLQVDIGARLAALEGELFTTKTRFPANV